MEDYFSSEQFCSVVAKLQKNNKDVQSSASALIDLTLTFVRLNVKVSKKDITAFLNETVSKYQQEPENMKSIDVDELNKIGYKCASKYFCKKNNLDPSSEETLAIVNERLSKMYKYHATNGANVENIQKNGLDPNASNEYQDEIDLILAMFFIKSMDLNKHNPEMLFGWQKINCENKVSYSRTPSVSYDYANRSPEWFSQFVGDSHEFDKDNPEHTKNAFKNRNYEGAKKNIMQKINEYQLDDQQREFVLEFFEKYWKKFAKSNTPTLIVIPDENKKHNEIMKNENFNDFVKNKQNVKVSDLIKDIEGYNAGGIDGQTTEKIDTSKAKYFELPSLELLKEKIAEIERKQQSGINPQEIDNDESISI